MDLKREMVRKGIFNLFFSKSSFQSMHAHFQQRHSWRLCIYAHSLLGAARYNHSLRLPAAEQLQPSSWGGQGHLDGSCWEADWHLSYTNISQRQSFSGGRKEMSLFVSNLNDRGKFICAATFNRRTVREDLKETQGEKRDIWWDLDK